MLFWLGLAVSVMLKGPIGPMVVVLTILALVIWDRRARWLRTLGWDWGLILFAAVTLPWALAITVATDGAFWGIAVGGDLAPKLLGGQEGHGAPPGYYAALSPLLLFPACLLLPAALISAWRARAEPGIRFALCWMVPSYLVFELVPTKLPHYTLPTFGALAWMMAAALGHSLKSFDRWSGVALVSLASALFIGAGFYAAYAYGDVATWVWAVIAAILFAGAAISGSLLLLRRRAGLAAAAVIGVGIAAHGALIGGLAPSLQPLRLSDRVAKALAAAKISPLQGLAEGPVTVAGYAEPSIVFAPRLHHRTRQRLRRRRRDRRRPAGGGRGGAREAAFRKSLVDRDVTAARLIGAVSGLDYSTGKPQILRIYEPVAGAPAPEG